METDEFGVQWADVNQGLTPCDPLKIQEALNSVLATTVTNPKAWSDELTLTVQVIHPVLNNMGITQPLLSHYDHRLLNIIHFLKDHADVQIPFCDTGFREDLITALATLPFSKQVKVKDGDIEITVNRFYEKEVFSKASEIRQQKLN